jgi:hypothetical protein
VAADCDFLSTAHIPTPYIQSIFSHFSAQRVQHAGSDQRSVYQVANNIDTGLSILTRQDQIRHAVTGKVALAAVSISTPAPRVWNKHRGNGTTAITLTGGRWWQMHRQQPLPRRVALHLNLLSGEQ